MANGSTVSFGLRITRHMNRTLDAQAKRLGKTKATIIRDAIEAYESQERLERLFESKLNAMESRIMEAAIEGVAAAAEARDSARKILDYINNAEEEK